MSHPLPLIIQSVITLLLVLNPAFLVPVFLSLTRNTEKRESAEILFKACLAGFTLLIILAVAGKWILNIFSLDIYDFLISGGIILLLIAIRIVFTSSEISFGEQKPGILPFAIPIMVGPGTVTATIMLAETAGILYTLISVVLAFAVTWAILRVSSRLFDVFGKEMMDIAAKVNGLVLAAISIHYIRVGIISILPK